MRTVMLHVLMLLSFDTALCAIPCIAVPMQGGKPAIWAAGDGSGGSTKDGFLGYDMEPSSGLPTTWR